MEVSENNFENFKKSIKSLKNNVLRNSRIDSIQFIPVMFESQIEEILPISHNSEILGSFDFAELKEESKQIFTIQFKGAQLDAVKLLKGENMEKGISVLMNKNLFFQQNIWIPISNSYIANINSTASSKMNGPSNHKFNIGITKKIKDGSVTTFVGVGNNLSGGITFRKEIYKGWNIDQNLSSERLVRGKNANQIKTTLSKGGKQITLLIGNTNAISGKVSKPINLINGYKSEVFIRTTIINNKLKNQ